MEITEEHKKLLAWLSPEVAYRYKGISENTGIPVKHLKELMLELKIAGYVFWTQTINYDWMYNGSGHLLTNQGEKLQEELKIEVKAERYFD